MRDAENINRSALKTRAPFWLGAVAILIFTACHAGASASQGMPLSPAPADSNAHPVSAASSAGVESFNQAMRDATLRMDSAAIVALWEDDGVTLLPGDKAIVGKKAIFDAIDTAVKGLPDPKMESFEMTCAGIEATADTASEYCDEHQVVSFKNGDPPFDGRGKVLFVLHRGPDGKWRLRREMWNQGERHKREGAKSG